MHIPKRYGQSRVDKCPFCGQQAITINTQQVPVCERHKNSMMNEMRCVCGSFLQMKNGKYGVFFTCLRCGNMNMRKVLEINPVSDVNNLNSKKPVERKQTLAKADNKPREITVRSDDPLYFE
jgi:hypothetical protein